MFNGLYRFSLYENFVKSLINLTHNFGLKRSAHSECSTFLWYQRLCYIFQEKTIRLVKIKILHYLNFTNWDICVVCVKGKQINHTSKHPTIRSNELHTDICGLLDIPSWNKEKYFITFVDNFSWYCYLHLLHKKF